jgi:ferredoxin-NADP reductase/ferredoxin
MVTIEFEGARYEVRDGESALEALLRGGANVAFSCRKGTCQVCMLQVLSGELDQASQERVRPDLAEAGMFVPCCSYPMSDLVVQAPDPSLLYTPLHLFDREWLSERICRLRFEPERNLPWKPGQFVNLRRDDGLVRSYSIASDPEFDYFLEIHVKMIDAGKVSGWLCDTMQPGEVIDAQGPLGAMFYEPEWVDDNLLMLATGTGLAPLIGMAKQALRMGHRGEIVIHHGSRHADGLYLRDELTEIAAQYPNFSHHACLSRGDCPEGVERGRVVDFAFPEGVDLTGWRCFFAGIPEMTYEARVRAVLAGVLRPNIHADPFEFAHRFEPTDREKIDRLQGDPELWKALDDGRGLMTIIRAFYDQAFEDARLAPFFHRVTKQRAIEKQYSFLRDMFTGVRDYFGLRPFNAHHWMIISDELFDYREAMFEQCVRDYGLPEHLIRRWNAIHELFRREIVKAEPRGIIIDGEEQMREGFSVVTLDVATVCDGCVGEINEGDVARLHNRTGELYCEACKAQVAAPH